MMTCQPTLTLVTEEENIYRPQFKTLVISHSDPGAAWWSQFISYPNRILVETDNHGWDQFRGIPTLAPNLNIDWPCPCFGFQIILAMSAPP